MATTTLTFEQAYELAPQQEYFHGNPPEVGWWMTKSEKYSLHAVRYWSGEYWSVYFTPCSYTKVFSNLNEQAKVKTSFSPDEIQYCERFWEGK